MHQIFTNLTVSIVVDVHLIQIPNTCLVKDGGVWSVIFILVNELFQVVLLSHMHAPGMLECCT